MATLTADQQRVLDALRSGNYKQGRGALRTEDDEYCCLGVMCDTIDPTGWGSELHDITGHDVQAYPHGPSLSMEDANVFTPPDNIRQTLALTGQAVGDLAELNDGYEMDFLTIADLLEAYWLEFNNATLVDPWYRLVEECIDGYPTARGPKLKGAD